MNDDLREAWSKTKKDNHIVFFEGGAISWTTPGITLSNSTSTELRANWIREMEYLYE